METPKSTDLKERIATILQSITTAAVLGCFGFLWNMNRDIGVMQERDRLQGIALQEFKLDQKNELKLVKVEVNEVKGSVIDVKGQIIQLQSIQDEFKNYVLLRK